jgi:hypothetical protein
MAQMTESSSVIDVAMPDVPVEESVLSALRAYIQAVEAAQMVLVPFGKVEAATQAELNQISGVIAVVEHTQLTLFSALRSVGRPVPTPIHNERKSPA